MEDERKEEEVKTKRGENRHQKDSDMMDAKGSDLMDAKDKLQASSTNT